jgi:hypothetical protein
MSANLGFLGLDLLGAKLGSTLSRDLLGTCVCLLGDFSVGLLGNEFDMGGARHVWADSTVGAVGSSSHIGSLVGLGVGDLHLLDIETLELDIGLEVSQHVKKALGGLGGESNLVTRHLVLLGDGVSADTTSVLGERNTVLLNQDVLEVGLGLGELHAFDGAADLSAVLVVHSQVCDTSLNG